VSDGAEIWRTAREWAAETLPGLPSTERAIQIRARREAWPSRERQGRGGGREYPLSALPVAARKAFDVRSRRQLAAGALVERAEADRRQIATAAATALTGRQRGAMEARAAILIEVERRVAVDGMTVTASVRSLAADSVAGQLPADLAAAAVRANDRSDGSGVLSERSLYRWRSAKGDGGVTALAPQPTRTAEAPAPWLRDFLRFYATPQKRTVAHALDMWRRSAPAADLPTYRQVQIALGKLGAVDRARGRLGPQALKSLQAYKSRDTSDLLPTSVYVADGKTFDGEVAHPIHGQPFRPEITTIIDAHTRRIVGWSAALDESASAVTDALRAACCAAGIPALFYTDRGSGYRNAAMDAPLTGLLGRLDITPMRALPYNSQAKGLVERVNQMWSTLAREVPTYISRDMDREAKTAVHKRTRRDLALVGASALLPAWADFLAAAEDAIARYNERPHTGLPRIRDPETGKPRHASPDEMWAAARSAGFEPLTVSAEEADDLFRPWEVRKARRCIVEWLGNEYFAVELEPFHGREVIVGYDLKDAGRVWVREIDLVDGERQPGRLIAVAAWGGHRTRYVPVSAEQAAMERRNRGRLKRLEKKLDVVRQELRPAALIDGRTSPPVAPIVATERPAPAPASRPAAIRPDGRPRFDDDVSWARWIIDHPDAATASDRALAAEIATQPTMQRLLAIEGVDVTALRAIARNAA